MLKHLETVYGTQASEVAKGVQQLIKDYPSLSCDRGQRWTQEDVVLITYGDQVQCEGEPSLRTLSRFLTDYQLRAVINTVHLLPFCPYSSDDGFSVIDYLKIDSSLGDWGDVAQLGASFDLMFDFVLNHISQHSDWYQGFLRDEAPYRDFFHVVDPATDLSQVTRPRNLPLLTPAQTRAGLKHVWTTFSADQIDLDFASPELLLRMTAILLEYVRRGARIVRLDAIAFLWKELGTNCINLPQTHAIVKFLRSVLDAVAPHVILLTETNIPHHENISYLGDADEAHMVYQFSLPPLLLDAVLRQDASLLIDWLDALPAPAPGTTFFNFTASHDGVGVRPLEGLVDSDRLDQLVAAVRAGGGQVSTRTTATGQDRPYELNVAYVDAVGQGGGVQRQAQRFLATQAIMLSLQGIPGIYFHSLVGTQNDTAAVEETGQPRRINRRKFHRDELDRRLGNSSSLQSLIFRGYIKLLEKRRLHSAFHPDGKQQILRGLPQQMVGIERTSPDLTETVRVFVNLSDDAVATSYGEFEGYEVKFEV